MTSLELFLLSLSMFGCGYVAGRMTSALNYEDEKEGTSSSLSSIVNGIFSCAIMIITILAFIGIGFLTGVI